MITTIPDRERTLQAEVDALTAELARLRAQEPVAPPGWREALQFYADRSHFVIADADAWDTVSGEPSNFWCDNGTATVEDGTVAKMALAGTPLSDEDDDGAAPPAQPAEPVQRLSDERAAFEAWHNEYRTQELVRRDDTYYNTHVRCRWEGWQARAIESALQPGWRDIETPPGWKLVPICLTPEMREVLLMADRFTVGEVYIMLLAAAPKATK